MAFTRVQIISHALTLLGRKPISSLNNQGDLVNSADQAFDLLYTSVLSTSFWRFATTISELAKLNEVPIGKYWLYSYMLPSDYLKLVHLYPPIYDFELYKNSRLYSNYNNDTCPLYVEYIFKPDETLLPSYFVKYFAYELASYLALSNAQVPDYAPELERRRTIELAIAQAADTQNRPQTSLKNIPMLSLRYVSTFVGG